MRALLMISAGMLGLLKGALSRLQKASRESRGFLFTDSELTICAVWRCCSPHLACLWHYSPLPQTNPAMDLSLDSIMKKRCVDYRIYCDLRERCSEQIVYKALPERFSK